jgi:hypothetical protein
MKTDPLHGRRYVEETLVFCLRIEGNAITGEVFDSQGVRLSSVTGTHIPFGPMERAFMSLAFKWEPSEILVAGFSFKSGSTKFQGRFISSAITDAPNIDEGAQADLLGSGPDPGDTGTGTGQQT